MAVVLASDLASFLHGLIPTSRPTGRELRNRGVLVLEDRDGERRIYASVELQWVVTPSTPIDDAVGLWR
jgi:hypothetical protein